MCLYGDILEVVMPEGGSRKIMCLGEGFAWGTGRRERKL